MLDPTLDNSFFEQAPPRQGNGPRPMLRFFTEPVKLEGKSVAEGRPVYEDRDYVGITNPGSRDEVIRRADEKAREDDFVAWAYRKWKATQEQPVDGTALETVAFLSKAQVMELKGVNIVTLEQLAELPDTAKQRFMGAEALQKQARAYLQNAKDNAVVVRLQAELHQRDQTIAMMQKQMDQMSARFDEMQKKVLLG